MLTLIIIILRLSNWYWWELFIVLKAYSLQWSTFEVCIIFALSVSKAIHCFLALSSWVNPEICERYGIEANANDAWKQNGGGKYSRKINKRGKASSCCLCNNMPFTTDGQAAKAGLRLLSFSNSIRAESQGLEWCPCPFCNSAEKESKCLLLSSCCPRSAAGL